MKTVEISDENGKTRITKDNLYLFDEMTEEEAEGIFG